MSLIADYALDAALAKMQEATHIYVCSAEPATFTEASATLALGGKAGPVINGPADALPNGRKVTVAAFTGGSVTASGTPAFWALVDTPNSRLLAAMPVANAHTLTAGNELKLTSAIDIRIPDAA